MATFSRLDSRRVRLHRHLLHDLRALLRLALLLLDLRQLAGQPGLLHLHEVFPDVTALAALDHAVAMWAAFSAYPIASFTQRGNRLLQLRAALETALMYSLTPSVARAVQHLEDRDAEAEVAAKSACCGRRTRRERKVTRGRVSPPRLTDTFARPIWIWERAFRRKQGRDAQAVGLLVRDIFSVTSVSLPGCVDGNRGVVERGRRPVQCVPPPAWRAWLQVVAGVCFAVDACCSLPSQGVFTA